MKILVFDTETTGLPEKNASIYDTDKWPHIVQLSYVLYDIETNQSIIQDNYIKISESVIISERSYEIHNLSHELLRTRGINIVDALTNFNNMLKICDVAVGHNVSFDKRMIYVECFRNKLSPCFTWYVGNKCIKKNEYCTMRNSTQLCNIVRTNKFGTTYIKSPTLMELYQHLFPDANLPTNLHNSIVDVLITLQCYIKLVYDKNILSMNNDIAAYFIKNVNSA
jgi:DNA polymerase III epsilon subunit-like protein